MTSYIDTHCHLNLPPFNDSEIEELVQRAKSNHVSQLINVGIDIKSSKKAIEISNLHSHCFASAGVHPHESANVNQQTIVSELATLLTNKKIKALGEIGLDYHYMNAEKNTQKNIFRTLLELAKEKKLPAIIHSRDAEQDTLEIIKEVNAPKFVIHCFTASKEMAKSIVDLGGLLSFTGIITFKNSQSLRDIIEWLPLEKIMIETDSPYLAPIPHRGKRNEPSYLPAIAQTIADVKKISLNQLNKSLTQTSQDFFSLPSLTDH
jgi:TatD DNase family protein